MTKRIDLTKEDMKRLALIGAGPRKYMAGGRINEKLGRAGYVHRDGNGLWVTLTITDAGRALIPAPPTTPGGRTDG